MLTFSNSEKIETTKDHPFYVEGKGFVKAGELGIGTSIVSRAGPSIQIVDIQVKAQSATVYNFSVEDFHTYFVGHSSLCVHNADCARDAIWLDHFFSQKMPPDFTEGLAAKLSPRETMEALQKAYPGKKVFRTTLEDLRTELKRKPNARAIAFGDTAGDPDAGHAVLGLTNNGEVGYWDGKGVITSEDNLPTGPILAIYTVGE